MKLIKTYEEIVKKSRFIGLMYEIESVDEAEKIIKDIRLEHKKARHTPYAYKLPNTARKSDDKEPSNTAGFPIYNTIERNNLNNTLIIIIRYFGGIKLGVGLLTRTYASVASNLVKNDENISVEKIKL